MMKQSNLIKMFMPGLLLEETLSDSFHLLSRKNNFDKGYRREIGIAAY